MYPQQSILPDYDVFSQPPDNLPQFGRSPARAPVGQISRMPKTPVDPRLAIVSPGVAAYQMLRNPRAVQGLGQLGSAASLALTGAVIVVGGILGYQAGKAMTPPGSSESTWAWIGVPVGLLTGTLGLGIMGAVSNYKD